MNQLIIAVHAGGLLSLGKIIIAAVNRTLTDNGSAGAAGVAQLYDVIIIGAHPIESSTRSLSHRHLRADVAGSKCVGRINAEPQTLGVARRAHAGDVF